MAPIPRRRFGWKSGPKGNTACGAHHRAVQANRRRGLASCSTATADAVVADAVARKEHFTPEEWLADDRLVVSGEYVGGATWLLSPALTSPTKISSTPTVGALA